MVQGQVREGGSDGGAGGEVQGTDRGDSQHGSQGYQGVDPLRGGVLGLSTEAKAEVALLMEATISTRLKAIESKRDSRPMATELSSDMLTRVESAERETKRARRDMAARPDQKMSIDKRISLRILRSS